MTAALTARQAEVLAYILDYRTKLGYAPAIRDIVSHFGWSSTRAAVDHIDVLVKKGVLMRDPGRARTLRPPGKNGGAG